MKSLHVGKVTLCLAVSVGFAAAQAPEDFGRRLAAGEELHRRGAYAEAEKQLLALLAEADAVKARGLRKSAVLHNLGSLYHSMDKYPQAEKCYRRAIEIEKAAGADASEFHFRTTVNLACLYIDMGQHQRATRLGLRSLAENRPMSRRDDADFARLLATLGGLEFNQGRLAAAERFELQALKIWENLAPNGIEVMEVLNNLGVLYWGMERKEDARAAYTRALAIAARLPPDNPAQVTLLANVGAFYAAVDGPAAAEPLYDRALTIAHAKLGDEHAVVAQILSSYAVLLEKTGRKGEAKQYHSRAQSIRDTSRRTDPRRHTVDVKDVPGSR